MYTYTAPASTTTAQVEFNVNTAVVGATFDMTGAMLEETDRVLPYFDGSSVIANTENAWTGATDTSTSIQRRIAIPEEAGTYVVKTGDTFSGQMNTQSMIPSSGGVYDLGALSTRYNNIYTGSLFLGNASGIRFVTSNATDIGTSTGYGRYAYFNRFYVNSTAYIDGSTAGKVAVTGDIIMGGTASGITGATSGDITRIFGGSSTTDGAGIVFGGSTNGAIPNTGLLRVGASEVGRWTTTGLALGAPLSTLPTHTLTLTSSGSGIALYNTSDTVTNFERGVLSWVSNVLTLSVGLGGTGSNRQFRISGVGGSMTLNSSSSSTQGVFYFTGSAGATATNHFVSISPTYTNPSGSGASLSIMPTINQSGTASYTALFVNVTETATGSGPKNLADFRVGNVSKASIDNNGKITAPNITSTYVSATEPTSPVVGDLWVVL